MADAAVAQAFGPEAGSYLAGARGAAMWVGRALLSRTWTGAVVLRADPQRYLIGFFFLKCGKQQCIRAQVKVLMNVKPFLS